MPCLWHLQASSILWWPRSLHLMLKLPYDVMLSTYFYLSNCPISYVKTLSQIGSFLICSLKLFLKPYSCGLNKGWDEIENSESIPHRAKSFYKRPGIVVVVQLECSLERENFDKTFAHLAIARLLLLHQAMTFFNKILSNRFYCFQFWVGCSN